MRVSELMQVELEAVSPETPISDVFVALAESRISALPVVDNAGRLVGVISKTDILAQQEEAEGESDRTALFERTQVRDLMTSPVLTISPDAGVRDAAQQMLTAGVHRLFVTDRDRAVGIISVTDILQAVAAGKL
jgi:CBS domain-containing protein